MATNAASLFDQSLELYKGGAYNDALQYLLQIYGQKQGDFKVLNLIVDCLDQLKMPRETADFLSQALSANNYSPKNKAQLNFRLGNAYTKLGEYYQAKIAYMHAQQLDPELPGLEEKLKQTDTFSKRLESKYIFLTEKGLLTINQLEEAKKRSEKENRDLDQLLMDQYEISKQDIGESLSMFYNVSFAPFDPKTAPPFEIFEKRNLDPNFLKRYCWVPFAQRGDNIEVLVTDPLDLAKLDEIRFILGKNSVEPRVALKQDIEAYIDHFYKAISGEEELTGFDEQVESDFEIEDEAEEFEVSTLTDDNSEIVRLVNAILVEAWKQGASDIHIEPNPISRFCSVRFRVDGSCFEFKKLRLSLAKPMTSRIKIMAHLNIAERRLPQDGKVKLKLPKINRIVEYRVATLPTIEGQEDVTLRVLASGKPQPLEQLGMNQDIMHRFKQCIFQPHGLVVVVGPTGSGKSTTLHSALSNLNSPERKIWTAEDPVEITQEGLRQVNINPKIGLTFAAAMRSFLRADPDIIMIGEMRDRETAHIGIEASLTGHLVLSTLHTNSAPETVTRLLELDLDPFNFSDSLICVLAQRLIKNLCPDCKEAYRPDKKIIEELKMEFGQEWKKYFPEDFLKDPVLYKAMGCSRCVQGYRGRQGVFELLVSDENIQNLIKRKAHTGEIKQQAKENGMLSLKQDGILKVLQGNTDIKQVRKVAGD